MKINNKLIDQLGALSKLKFDKDSKEKMKNDLEKMILFIDKLSEIKTQNIDPLIYLSDEQNILRKDIPAQNTTQKAALKNAPQKDSDYFKVPKILKK